MGRSRKKKRDRHAARRSKGGGRSPIPAALRGGSGVRFVAGRGSQKKKLSEAILELIAPYGEEPLHFSGYRALVTMGCLAWNLALLAEPERRAKAQEAARIFRSAERRLFHEIIDSLISRKQSLFPDDRRMVVSHEITPTERGFHLLVASAPVVS